MEREIGEVFEIIYEGEVIKLKVVEVGNEFPSCDDCIFSEGKCYEDIVMDQIGVCLSTLRSDRKSVIFKEVK